MAPKKGHARSRSLAQVVDSAWSWTTDSVSRTAWNPMAHFAQSSLLKILNKIVLGKIVLKYKSGEYVFGDKFDKGVTTAELVIKKDTFWTRIVSSMDLGFAEGFIFGDFECDDLPALLRIIIMNRRHLMVESSLAKLITAPQNPSAAQANLPTQFDLPNAFFAVFLGDDMDYSSAIFRNHMEDLVVEYPIESLADAQKRKMMHIITKAKLKRGHRVLEIGSGWGSWAILAARTTGCFIDTIALTAQQQILAMERIKQAGLSSQIKVHLIDFRDCMKNHSWEHSFDRIISIGSLETLGRDKIADFWKLADWALTYQSGVGVIQTTTLADARVDKAGGSFIQKWLFPGSHIPSYASLVQFMNTTSEGRLVTDSVSNIASHSARTFREWKREFVRRFDYDIAPMLKNEYGIWGLDIEWFRRKWIYFFDYCEAGFVTRILGSHVITFTRDGNEGFGCDFDATCVPTIG